VIAQGETVSTEYFVLDDTTITGYYRPQVYTFSAPVSLNPDANAGANDDRVAFGWSLSLSVERGGDAA
jgi:hypothetical protein